MNDWSLYRSTSPFPYGYIRRFTDSRVYFFGYWLVYRSGGLDIYRCIGLPVYIFVGLHIPTNYSLHPHRFAWTPIEISVCRFACRKIGPISTRCNPCPLRAVYGRSAGFCSSRNRRNIAPGAQPALTTVHDPHRSATSPRSGNHRRGETPWFRKADFDDFRGIVLYPIHTVARR